MYKVFFSLLIIWHFLPNQIAAQTNDNILWLKLKMTKELNKKTSLALTPIVRSHQNFSEYFNSSIDFSVKQKFEKNWSVQLLSRTWFVPSAQNRQFIWLDIGKRYKMENYKLSSRLRFHYAFDIKSKVDPDFLRWRTDLTYTKWKKSELSIAIEPWYRLNEFTELQRMRYDIGWTYKLSDHLKGTLRYWRENSVNLEPIKNNNIFHVIMSYAF